MLSITNDYWVTSIPPCGFDHLPQVFVISDSPLMKAYTEILTRFSDMIFDSTISCSGPVMFDSVS